MRRDLRRVDVGMGGPNPKSAADWSKIRNWRQNQESKKLMPTGNIDGLGVYFEICDKSQSENLPSFKSLFKFNLGHDVETYWIGVLP